jgi:hypothetical protein
MPQLGRYAPLLKSVFFLYPDVASAGVGLKAGGTGFLVGVPMKRVPGWSHVHAVTNYHVVVFNEEGPPNPVIRINRLSGKPEAFDLDPSEWIFQPNGPDVAVSPPLRLMDAVHDYKFFDAANWLITKEEETEKEISPGEDVFMIGRFVDYDGVETNVPATRFGHISMMDARIEQSTGYKGRSIVLDMHSRSGFSGSPVIVYRTLGSQFLSSQPGQVLTGASHYISLIGIHYAQFLEPWEIKAKKKTTKVQVALDADEHYIEGLSGMSCVIPAAHIRDLITNNRELVAMREKIEADIIRSNQAPKRGSKPKAP